MELTPTNTSQISALSALWLQGGTWNAQTQGASSSGPAVLLSLGNTDSQEDGTYSSLASQALLPQFDMAVLISAQTIRQPPAPPKLSEAQKETLEQAFDLIEMGQLDAAETAIKGLLATNKNNGFVVHALGLVEVERYNFESAEKLFRRADYLAPGRGYADDANDARTLGLGDGAVFEQASRYLLSSETRQRGIGLLLRLTEQQPNNAEAALLLAESLFANNDVINGLGAMFKAIDVADTAQLERIKGTTLDMIEMLPEAPQFRRLLGRTQLHLGQFEEALVTLGTAADMAGSDLLTSLDTALAHAGLGRQLLREGDLPRALVNLDQAKALQPTHPEVREAVAEGLLAYADRSRRFGNYRNAISKYHDAARTLGSAGSETLRKRIAGGAYVAGLRMEQQSVAASRDIDDEALAFQAAFDLDPDNIIYKRKLAETRTTLGNQFLRDEEYGDAAAAYRRAYDLYRNDETYKSNVTNAYRLHGDALIVENNFDAAIEAYRNAYEIDVNDGTSKAALAAGYNSRGLNYVERSRFGLAVLDFKEALLLEPDNAEYQANYESVRGYDT